LEHPSHVKGIGSPDKSLMAYKTKSVHSVHEQMVLKFLACLVQEKSNYKVFACSFETRYLF
jgi:hypothetical protein